MMRKLKSVYALILVMTLTMAMFSPITVSAAQFAVNTDYSNDAYETPAVGELLEQYLVLLDTLKIEATGAVMSQNVPLIWHSDANRVGFWPGTINVHAHTLGTVSNGFSFHYRMLEAQRAWANALGVTITGVTQAANAQIRSWGGTAQNIADHLGRPTFPYEGLAEIVWWTPRAGTITVGGVTRNAYELASHNRMWVRQRSTAASWTQDDINRTRNTTAHELGHVLGYIGHSPRVAENNQDVMWWTNHAGFTLRQNEIRHLRQIYDHFR